VRDADPQAAKAPKTFSWDETGPGRRLTDKAPSAAGGGPVGPVSGGGLHGFGMGAGDADMDLARAISLSMADVGGGSSSSSGSGSGSSSGAGVTGSGGGGGGGGGVRQFLDPTAGT